MPLSWQQRLPPVVPVIESARTHHARSHRHRGPFWSRCTSALLARNGSFSLEKYPLTGIFGRLSGMLDRRGGYEYEDLLACARGELFGPGNAQLPLPPMLMFDRITDISETGGEYGKGLVRAELDVKPDLWFFGCHFKNDPVMPGCLGLDAMWQMGGFYLGWVGGAEGGRAGAAERPQGCVQHRHQTRNAHEALVGHC